MGRSGSSTGRSAEQDVLISDTVRVSQPYEKGDRVRYVAASVFDLIIKTGETGTVERVEGDWVFAWWPRSGLHSVPLTNVEPADG